MQPVSGRNTVFFLVFFFKTDIVKQIQDGIESGKLHSQKTASQLGIKQALHFNGEVLVKAAHVIIRPMKHLSNSGTGKKRLEGR